MAIIRDLFIDRGTDYSEKITISANTGSVSIPFPLEEGSILAYIKTSSEDIDPFLIFTVTIVDAHNGIVLLDLSHEETLLLTRKKYLYDVMYLNTFGQIYKVVEGLIIVTPSVTTINE